ncbi:MAG: YsnF/AvaK domain-containing protein [Pyrinomonadaceae bacterium]
MSKTIVGLFDNYREAQRAAAELIESGIAREDVGITAREHASYEGESYREESYRDDEGFGDKVSNFFSNLFGDDREHATHYSEAVTGGGAVVTVDCESEEMADRAESILNRFGGEVDEHGESHRQAAYAGTETAATGRADVSESGVASIPVIEEELRVGKREVEGGGVRVRTRVVERPVEEVVRLREERVNVERRPVNRALTDADLRAFREGEFELRERSEEVVVDKSARVVEEVAVNKEVGERTETVRDTVRSTDVDVEQTGDVKVRGASANASTTDDLNRRKR